LFPPERPAPPAAPSQALEQPGAESPETAHDDPVAEPIADEIAEEAGGPIEAVAAESEQIVRFENDVMVVEASNRGAAITSFQLIGFKGDAGEQLDLIQTVDHPDRALPLQLVDGEGPDLRLYTVEETGDGAVFRWSDGLGSAVTKTIHFPAAGYGIDVEITQLGALRDARLSAGTGLRDLGEAEQNSRLAVWGDAVVLADGELEVFKRRKTKASQQVAPHVTGFAGLQDAYFLSILRPAGRIDGLSVNVLQYAVTSEDGKVDERRVLQVELAPAGGRFEGQLLGVPKEYNLLQEIGGGVEKTLDFGFFGPISVIFLKAMRWIYGAVGNWGVTIILLTVAIRILLFPLMHTSTVSMRRMQKLQPKVKEIQAKYKKKKADPQARAKMNQEMMALYKVEGVNPMGGCLPMLVQLPILWALYRLFLQAIELRHAPFFGWILDLSAKDPLYITPILMTATMWLQQKLAPQVGDPQQQRIMRMLPFVFGFMFLQFPSGLVLYWLTNNVLTIIQQEVTFRLLGERKSGGSKSSKRGEKK
jgi:YidC/Oxa1 family membrane protein insertase